MFSTKEAMRQFCWNIFLKRVSDILKDWKKINE